MDARSHNRAVWEAYEDQDSPWTRPVSTEAIAAARQGQWQVYLTPTTPVPRAWLDPLLQRAVLCLASGGGQQGPILAAAGAIVTVLDFSHQQLARDRAVATRDRLALATVHADMTDLSMFAGGSFD
jgi:2-polyprenyl-3-methyl-5-hydroxy-6-metoxy-1,4-benzoquinol methylase